MGVKVSRTHRFNRTGQKIYVSSRKTKSATMQVKNFVILLSCAAALASCKNGLFGKNKHEKSEVTGWNYNDKNMGGYQVAKTKEQNTGPGLVFVQGGTFTMGQTE